MKKNLALFVAFVMLVSMIPMASFAATINVEPGNGTLNNAVSQASSGDTLILGDGLYYSPAIISISKNLTIKAQEGTTPVIVGGQPATGWELYEGNIYRKESSANITSMVEGNRAGKIATSGTYMVAGLNGNTISSASIPAGLKTGYAKVITYGATSSNWQTTVNTITENSAGSLTFQGSTARGLSVGSIFDLINDVSLINEAGEFAYDGEYVYYYPYDASKLETDVCFITTPTLFNINSGSSLTLEGLDIAGNPGGYYSGGSYVGNNAINVLGSADIQKCDFFAVGSNAIMYHRTATGLNVSDCTFNGVGGTAIYLYGNNATVSNNAMVNIGFEYSGGAISIEGNNNTVSHNNISYCVRWGINMCGAGTSNGYGNVIEYNDISHCNTKTSDSGLIYLYRMDGTTETKRNTIRFNAIHDSVCNNSMGFGIYLDDDADYTDVYGNWVYNLSYNTQDDGYLMGPIMIKGVGSEIHDNVIANNRVTQDYQSGAGNNNAAIVAQQLQGYNTSANKVYRNIAYNNGLAGNNRLYRVLDSEPLSNTFAYVDYNVYDKSEGQHSVSAYGAWDMSTWKSNGLDTHALFGINPFFTDAESGDFTVNNPNITEQYYQNPLRKEYIGIVSDSIVIPTMAPTEVPATPEPVGEYNEFLPIAGQSRWNGQDGNAYREGNKLFVWSDSARALLGAGEEAMIHFNITTAPVSITAMRDNDTRMEEQIVTFEETGTAILALIPNGNLTDFYAYQNGEYKSSGTIQLPFNNTWNYNVSNSNNINNIYISSVSRWERIPGTATEPPATEPPATEPPATEPPATEPPVTEPPVTEPPVTEPPVTEPPVTEPPVTEPPATEPPVTEPPVTEAPEGELFLSKNSVSLKVGKSVSVKAYYNDVEIDVTDEAVWTSNKTSIATVSGGTIHGVKAGDATITVSYGGQTKEISVEVTSSGGSSSPSGGISRPTLPTEAPAAEKLFNDLDSVLWAVESIEALANAGIVNGVAEKTFDPNGLVTREQFAKMLIEACGFNYAGATCEFYDVVTGAWYYRYVAEAYRQGIMKGISEENMGIGMNITRQDLCTMVYRALQGMGIELPELETAEVFADDANISDYAREAVTALQMAGIIDGMGDGTFAPQETATRAQAAKIIYGVYKLIQENK